MSVPVHTLVFQIWVLLALLRYCRPQEGENVGHKWKESAGWRLLRRAGIGIWQMWSKKGSLGVQLATHESWRRQRAQYTGMTSKMEDADLCPEVSFQAASACAQVMVHDAIDGDLRRPMFFA